MRWSTRRSARSLETRFEVNIPRLRPGLIIVAMGDRPPEACIAADRLNVWYPGVSGGFVNYPPNFVNYPPKGVGLLPV